MYLLIIWLCFPRITDLQQKIATQCLQLHGGMMEYLIASVISDFHLYIS